MIKFEVKKHNLLFVAPAQKAKVEAEIRGCTKTENWPIFTQLFFYLEDQIHHFSTLLRNRTYFTYLLRAQLFDNCN